MALFKISKGKAAGIPSNKVEGYCYFTTDDGKFYIDVDKDTRVCLNAAKADIATKLASAATINGVGFDGSAAITNYAECATAGSTKVKTATINNFKLVTGARVLIKFKYANTASSPSLSISNLEAKPIKLYGTASMGVGTTTNGWIDGAIVPFTYDGTNWVRDYWENTIPTEYIPKIFTAADAKEKQATCANYTKENNRYFLLLNPLANAAVGKLTLSINGSTASTIYVNGTSTDIPNKTTVIPAGLYLVYYDGTNYRLNTNGEFPGGKFDDYLPRTAG